MKEITLGTLFDGIGGFPLCRLILWNPSCLGK